MVVSSRFSRIAGYDDFGKDVWLACGGVMPRRYTPGICSDPGTTDSVGCVIQMSPGSTDEAERAGRVGVICLLHHWRAAPAASCRSLGHWSPAENVLSAQLPLTAHLIEGGRDWNGGAAQVLARSCRLTRLLIPDASPSCDTCADRPSQRPLEHSSRHTTILSWNNTVVQPCRTFVGFFEPLFSARRTLDMDR